MSAVPAGTSAVEPVRELLIVRAAQRNACCCRIIQRLTSGRAGLRALCQTRVVALAQSKLKCNTQAVVVVVAVRIVAAGCQL